MAAKKKSSGKKATAKRSTSASPRDRALALYERALDTPDEDRFFSLLQQALTIDEHCVEALIELGRACPTPAAAIEYFERAVRSGQHLAGRAILPEGQDPERPDPWHHHETRPYMQAVAELAHAKKDINDYAEAARLFTHLLELNPNDNQGARFELAYLTILLRDLDGAKSLIERYPKDRSGYLASARVLLQFALHGDSAEAQAEFKRLKATNKHLVDELLEGDPWMADEIEFFAPGSPEEASLVARMARPAWASVPGAIAWLRERRIAARKSPHPKPVGPTESTVARLSEMPDHEPGIWEIGAVRMPTWVREGKRDLVRPWHITLMDSTSGACLDHDVHLRAPTAEYLFDRILKAATRPLAGDPGKPQTLRVHPAPFWSALETPLQAAGIELEYHDRLDNLDYATEAVRTAMIREQDAPSLIAMPGMNEERVRSFFAAAASYYRRRPWTAIRCMEPQFEVSCSRFDSGPWTGMIIGSAGISTALGLIDTSSAEAGPQPEREDQLPDFLMRLVRQSTMIQVTFGEAFDTLPADLDLIERWNLEIAAPEAYPQIGLLQGGDLTRSLLTWELELLEGCLRIIPDFCERFPEGRDGDEMTFDAPTVGGTLPIRIRWTNPVAPTDDAPAPSTSS